MAFEVPHKHDISLDGQDMRNQMIENFEAIEQEDHDDDQALSDEVADRKKGDGNLQGQINNLQERCQKLEDQVKQLQKDNDNHEERLKKIEQLLFGSETITVTDPTDDIRASQSATEISDTANDEDGSISTVVIS